MKVAARTARQTWLAMSDEVVAAIPGNNGTRGLQVAILTSSSNSSDRFGSYGDRATDREQRDRDRSVKATHWVGPFRGTRLLAGNRLEGLRVRWEPTP